MASAAQELEIVVRFRDLMSKGIGKAQRALLKFTAVGARGMKLMTGAMRGFKSALLGLPGLITGIASGAMVLLAKSMVGAASAAEETASRFRVSFGEVADDAEVAAKSISSGMGRSITEVRGSMADFGSLLASTGFGEEEALKTSEALTQLSIDLGSFQDVSDSRASGALRSALLGEAEALKSLNIFITEAKIKTKAFELGLVPVNGALTEQQKVMARLAVIMESNTLAHGDAARTADSYANSTKRVLSQVTGLREEMGAKLIVVIGETISALGGEAVVLEVVRTAFEFVVGIVSEFIKGAGTFIKVLKGITDALEAQGGALQFIGKVAAFVGNIIKVAFATAEVAIRGFEQGIDVVVFALQALWAGLQLLAGSIAFVILELVQKSIQMWGLFASALRWVVQVIQDGVVFALENMAEGLVVVMSNISDALGLFALLGGPMAGVFRKASHALDDVGDKVADFKEGLADVGDFSGLDGFIAGLDNAADGVETLQQKTLLFMGTVLEDLDQAGNDFVDDIMKDAEATNAALASMGEALILTGMSGSQLASDVEALITEFKGFNSEGPITIENAERMAESMARLGLDVEKMAENMNAATDSAGGPKAKGRLDTFLEFAGNAKVQLDQFAATTLQSFASGMSNAFMAFADGSKTAKEAFGDFAAGMLRQVAQMIIQMLVLRAISFFADGGLAPGGISDAQPVTGFANGGIVPGGMGQQMPVHGYANGGPLFNSPHIAVIGEGKFNEAVVPLPDGKRIPVEMKGGGGGGGSVSFNISMVDATGVDQLLTERRRTIEDLIGAGMTSRRGFRTTMQGQNV